MLMKNVEKFLTFYKTGKDELLMETLQYTLSANLGNKCFSSRITFFTTLDPHLTLK